MNRGIAVIAMAGLLSFVPPAAANTDAGTKPDRFEDKAKSFAMLVAKRSLKRARRSLVLGPTVGVAPTIDLEDGDVRFRTSIGASLLRFDIPILPTAESIAEILKSRAKARFVAELKAIALQGRALAEVEKEKLAQEVWQDIVDEFTLEHTPRRFEKPSFGFRASVRHLAGDGGAWELGFTVALGIGPIFLSGGETVQLNNGAGLNTDFEISLPITLSKGLRSPTAEIFFRASLANTDRKERPDRLLLGARIGLDII